MGINGFWQWLHDCLQKQVRGKQGRTDSSSVDIFDSQSIKTTTTHLGGPKGYDAATRIKRGMRNLLVDTLGLLICIIVHRADVEERQGAKHLLQRTTIRIVNFNRLKLFFADLGYGGEKMQDWVRNTFKALGWTLGIVKKIH